MKITVDMLGVVELGEVTILVDCWIRHLTKEEIKSGTIELSLPYSNVDITFIIHLKEHVVYKYELRSGLCIDHFIDGKRYAIPLAYTHDNYIQDVQCKLNELMNFVQAGIKNE